MVFVSKQRGQAMSEASLAGYRLSPCYYLLLPVLHATFIVKWMSRMESKPED
jgi:hypothetical protein